MPTYEYKCSNCGHTFERFQSITAEPIKRCPECGKAKVKRLIGTGAGMIFKGSGFYITDYRDSSYSDKAKAESGSGTSGGDNKASEGAKDAKPAAAESKPTESKSTADASAKPSSTPATPTAKSSSKKAGKRS